MIAHTFFKQINMQISLLDESFCRQISLKDLSYDNTTICRAGAFFVILRNRN